MQSRTSSSGRVSMLLALFLGYGSYYVGRKTFTNCMISLVDDRSMNLKKEHLGTVASGFMVMYTITKFLSGILSDRMSPKHLFVCGLILSGVVNCLFAFSANAWIFALLWCANGFFQGFGWPPCGNLISVWFQPSERGTVWSLVSAASSVSASITPFIALFLSVQFGWRLAFFSFGIFCILVSCLLAVIIHDQPPEPIGDQKQSSDKIKKAARSSQNPLLLLKSPFLQLTGLSFLISSIIKTAIEDWEQLFLIQAKGCSKYEASFAASSFQVGAVIGAISAGIVSDWCLRRLNNVFRGSPRIIVLVIYSSVMLFSFWFLHYWITDKSPMWHIGITSAALGCGAYGPHAIFGLLATENAPPGLSGTAHAIVALMAGGGNVIAGLPVAFLFSRYGWDTAFYSLELCNIACICVLSIMISVSPQIGRRTKSE